MTTRPVRPLICALAIPTIISMLTTAFYNMADTFYVSKIHENGIDIGVECTAAVGVAFSIMAIIQAFGFFFGHGSGNYISRQLGAKNIENARKMAISGVIYAFVCGVIIAIAGLLFLHPISVWLGATPTILHYTKTFLTYIFIGAPFMTVALTINTQMRFQGNAKYAMLGIIIGAIANVMLVPLLAFVFDMGIAGAAIATVTGQTISFFLLIYFCQKRCIASLSLKNFKPTKAQFYEILHGGIPSLSRQGLAAIAIIMLNVAAGRYGDEAIAAMSIVNRICNMIFAIVIGFGQGYQPVCGYNYGARLYHRVTDGYWFCVKTGTIFLLIVSTVGFVFATDIISVFQSSDSAVSEIGTAALRWQLLTLPLLAFATMSNMMLQTLRKSVRATILAAARQGLFFIPGIILLPRFFGLAGVESCQAISDLFTFAITAPLVWGVLKELNKSGKDDKQC
ncbi:MAG: MATE family efflux transporter [Bacteroidales bacterium]|nr:MATE family efflux transporter [Bacteroidales bacterium]